MARDHTATQPCEPITLTLEAITSCASVGGGESAAPGAGSMTAARGSRNTWGSKVKTRGERRVRHTCHTSHLTRHTSHVTRKEFTLRWGANGANARRQDAESASWMSRKMAPRKSCLRGADEEVDQSRI